MKQITSEELLQEKSLLAVYASSRRMAVNRLNQVVTLLVTITLSVYVALTPEATHQIAERVRAITDYGFAFATSILSFLIAGLTIYLTVTKVEHMVLMASIRQKPSGLPWIKYVSFSFLRIMFVYVIYCAACICIKLFASPGGLLTILASYTASPTEIKWWVASIGLVILGGATIHLVMLLQSFIFNIYNVSMTVLCLEMEKESGK